MANKPRKTAVREYLPFIIVLVVLSFLAIGIRIIVMGTKSIAGGDSLWRLTVHTSVNARSFATRLYLHPPYESKSHRLIQRNIVHPGFRIRNWSDEKEKSRSLQAMASANGNLHLSAEFVVLFSPGKFESKQQVLDIESRERYLKDTESMQLNHKTVSTTARELATNDPHQTVLSIYRYLRGMNVSSNTLLTDAPSILEHRHNTSIERSLAMTALCRAIGIPARQVSGIILQENTDTEPHYWVEVYFDNKWHAYDIQNGYEERVPLNYLPLQKNSDDILEVLNGELAAIEFELQREYDHHYLKQLDPGDYRTIIDLSRLPPESRSQLEKLLLLPLGVLVTALFRHMVGVRSYGVFTPTLLALSLVYANIIFTLVIFLVICSLAVAGRSIFPSNLERIPRLAIIFTLVAILLSLSVSVLDFADMQPGGHAILLPIIILTSLIDRLYRTIEEQSANIAMRRLLWTIIIALFCLPVIQFDTLGQLLVQYPETHLTTLALFLLISTYQGKKLIGLPVFRLLAEPASHKRHRSDNNGL